MKEAGLPVGGFFKHFDSGDLTFGALVGAMSLARAVSDEALSHEILKTVAHLLK